MNAIAVNEHLARLLLVQAGLLDAYLEQNLGERYAYAILVWEQAPVRRVRAVTNLVHAHALRPSLQDLARIIEGPHLAAMDLHRAPRFVEGLASAGHAKGS